MNLAHKLKFFIVPLAIFTIAFVPQGSAQAEEVVTGDSAAQVAAATGQPVAGNALAASDAWCDFSLLPLCQIINVIILGVPYLIGYLGGLLMVIAGYLVDAFFIVNTAILPDNFGIITAGFKTTLSITNLLFVVALLFIAFATILDSHHHGAQQMLGKLIIAAILVNFSLLIAGLLLDFSHVLASSFLTDGQASAGIADSLSPHKFLISPIDLKGEAATAPFVDQGWYRVVLGSLMMVLFTWLMMVVMLTVAIVLIVRYITLVFLIILMPIAWVLPFIPEFEKYGSQWWHSFLQQVIALPVIAFFVYLATQTANSLKNDITGFSKAFSVNAANAVAEQSLFTGLPQLIMQILVVAGLLIGGLVAATKSGAAGAGWARSFSEGVGKKIGKGVYRYSGARLAAQKTSRGIGNLLSIEGKGVAGVAGKALSVATLGQRKNFAGAFNKFGDNQQNIDEIKKDDYDGYTKQQLERAAAGPVPLLRGEAVALVTALNDNHMLDKLPHANEKSYIDAIKKVNPGTPPHEIELIKQIVAHNPFAAIHALKTKDGKTESESEAVARAFKNADKKVAASWDDSTLEHLLEEQGPAKFFDYVNIPKVVAIANTGDDRKIKVLNDAYEAFKKKRVEGPLSTEEEVIYQRIRKVEREHPGFQIYSNSGGDDAGDEKDDHGHGNAKGAHGKDAHGKGGHDDRGGGHGDDHGGGHDDHGGGHDDHGGGHGDDHGGGHH